MASFGCTRGELGEGLRRSILLFLIFNQELQVRGAVLCMFKLHDLWMVLCHYNLNRNLYCMNFGLCALCLRIGLVVVGCKTFLCFIWFENEGFGME